MLLTANNVYYPLKLLFINRMLINGVKSLHFDLNENIFPYVTFCSGLIYSTAYNITLKVFVIGTSCLQFCNGK